ncbi:Hypothetical_protein [Hexamita inflata]|uniref:Hypothetical_protein n=1 Tax=Hexamita inflata TaxID=28002 RepID=A0AA86ND26_9EUKA|nr:Hypothetical protein HINF_LOCUS4521 [Hexamita inflata]
MKNVQSSINGIYGQISNINNVNQIQNNEIQALKNQAGSNMNGALWCKMTKYNIAGFQQVQGYCSNTATCCYYNQAQNNIQLPLRCGPNLITMAQCGTFYTF